MIEKNQPSHHLLSYLEFFIFLFWLEREESGKTILKEVHHLLLKPKRRSPSKILNILHLSTKWSHHHNNFEGFVSELLLHVWPFARNIGLNIHHILPSISILFYILYGVSPGYFQTHILSREWNSLNSLIIWWDFSYKSYLNLETQF